MARRTGAQDEFVVQGMLNFIDRLGLVKAELKWSSLQTDGLERTSLLMGTRSGPDQE